MERDIEQLKAVPEKITVLFFDACFSYDQAHEVIQHVDAAIGMATSVSDEAACAFAAQFYSLLGFGLIFEKREYPYFLKRVFSHLQSNR